MSTLTDTATHIALHRQVDILRTVTALEQFRGTELHHDWWSAHDGDSIICMAIKVIPGEYLGYFADMAIPAVATLIHRQHHVETALLTPAPHLGVPEHDAVR